MWFIVSSLLEIFTELLCAILGYFTGDFWSAFKIPTGFHYDGEGGFSFSGSRGGFNSTDPKKFTMGYFDDYFVGMKNTRTAFKALGFSAAVVLATFSIAKSMIPDMMTGEKQEHPGATVFRLCITGVLVYNAYAVLALIQSPMAVVCDEVYRAGGTVAGYSNSPSSITGSNVFLSLKDYWCNTNTQASGSSGQSTAERAASNIGVRGGTRGTGVNPMAGNSVSNPIADVAAMLIVMICFLLILILFLKLIAEIIERYVVMGFLFYCAPLAFAFYATTNTSQITKKYMQMMISQYVLVIFNFIFVFIFFSALSHLGRVISTASAGSGINVIIYCFILAAWLRLATKMDEMLQSLGLSAARTGAGIGGELLAAGGSAIMAGRAMMKYGGKAFGKLSANTPGAAGGSTSYSTKKGNPASTNDSMQARQMNEDLFEQSRGGNGARNSAADIEGMTRDEYGSFHGTDAATGAEINTYRDTDPNYDPSTRGITEVGADGHSYHTPITAENENSQYWKDTLNDSGVQTSMGKAGFQEVEQQSAGVYTGKKDLQVGSDGNVTGTQSTFRDRATMTVEDQQRALKERRQTFEFGGRSYIETDRNNNVSIPVDKAKESGLRVKGMNKPPQKKK